MAVAYNPWLLKVATLLLLLLVSATSTTTASGLPPPSLSFVENALLTTATLDFKGHEGAFWAAMRWDGEQLRENEDHRPHLACVEDGQGAEAAACLRAFLGPDHVRAVSSSSTHGTCFIVTASHKDSTAMLADPTTFKLLTNFGPLPSALKIAPGILEHGVDHEGSRNSTDRLATTHGSLMRMENVVGLNVELSPGSLPANAAGADILISDLMKDLLSESINLRDSNVWSDPAASGGHHVAIPEGALRRREWSRAASVLQELGSMAAITPGEICSWGSLSFDHAAADLLLVSGAGTIGFGLFASFSTKSRTSLLLPFFANIPRERNSNDWY